MRLQCCFNYDFGYLSAYNHCTTQYRKRQHSTESECIQSSATNVLLTSVILLQTSSDGLWRQLVDLSYYTHNARRLRSADAQATGPMIVMMNSPSANVCDGECGNNFFTIQINLQPALRHVSIARAVHPVRLECPAATVCRACLVEEETWAPPAWI